MSIFSAINRYFDNLVEPSFQRDEQGRELFFPMGFGSRGGVVPDAATSARMRSALRMGYKFLFLVIIPAGPILTAGQPMSVLSIGLFVGIAVTLQMTYMAWLARGLEMSPRRMNVSNQITSIASTHSERYIKAMAICSAVLTAGGMIGLFLPAPGLPVGWALPLSAGSALFFAAMTVMWMRILKAKRQSFHDGITG